MNEQKNYLVMFRRLHKDVGIGDWDLWCAPFSTYADALAEMDVAVSDLNSVARENGSPDQYECSIFVKVTPAILTLMKEAWESRRMR